MLHVNPNGQGDPPPKGDLGLMSETSEPLMSFNATIHWLDTLGVI